MLGKRGTIRSAVEEYKRLNGRRTENGTAADVAGSEGGALLRFGMPVVI